MNFHKIAMRLAATCPKCHGSGFDTKTLENCPACGGTGKTLAPPTPAAPAPVLQTAPEEEKTFDVIMRVVGYKSTTVRAKNEAEAEEKASGSDPSNWSELNEENADIVSVREV
jgi:RecJ-like exonuclease